jgi:hypothetical protein
MNFSLNVHDHGSEGIVGFLEEVILHGLLDTLKIIPFLFLTYLLMEFIEHKASGKMNRLIKKAGVAGPLAGGLLGAVPQCGFSAMAANLYSGRVITAGTLIAIFLSTSDEMLPILISGSFEAGTIIGILLYKTAAGILAGFAVDIALKLMGKGTEDINIDELCESDGCNCQGGILRSALHHTFGIGLFLLAITLAINAAIFFIGQERLSYLLYDRPFISHLIAALFGLIPNCAASVALTSFFAEGLITMGTMLSGLFSGAGVGLLVLFRVNKHPERNLTITLTLVIFGLLFGILTDLTGLSSLLI